MFDGGMYRGWLKVCNDVIFNMVIIIRDSLGKVLVFVC